MNGGFDLILLDLLTKIKTNAYTYSLTANVPDAMNGHYEDLRNQPFDKNITKKFDKDILFLISSIRKTKQTINKQKLNKKKCKYFFHLLNKIF